MSLFRDELLGGPGFDYREASVDMLVEGARAGDEEALAELQRRGLV